MIDYGSDPNAEDSSAWSVIQAYNCANGAPDGYRDDYPLPEIYTKGTVSDWASLAGATYYMIEFAGVMSYPKAGLPWAVAWNKLNRALYRQDEITNDVGPTTTVIHWHSIPKL